MCAGIAHTRPDVPAGSEWVASVVYVYDQGTRELPKRLAHAYQPQHDLSVAAMRVAFDHESCMEVGC